MKLLCGELRLTYDEPVAPEADTVDLYPAELWPVDELEGALVIADREVDLHDPYTVTLKFMVRPVQA